MHSEQPDADIITTSTKFGWLSCRSKSMIYDQNATLWLFHVSTIVLALNGSIIYQTNCHTQNSTVNASVGTHNKIFMQLKRIVIRFFLFYFWFCFCFESLSQNRSKIKSRTKKYCDVTSSGWILRLTAVAAK